MSFDHEKGSSKDEHSAYVSTEPATAPGREGPALYDPSKESFATRLGVNFESFKRAPGSTGYVDRVRATSPSSSPFPASAH